MGETVAVWSEAVKRIKRRDFTLKTVIVSTFERVDENEVFDCLMNCPNQITYVSFRLADLTDDAVAGFFQHLATNSTMKYLDLSNNQLTESAYLALAAALRTNTSLRELFLYGNYAMDRTRIDTAFLETLRFSPVRPAETKWWLYEIFTDDYNRIENSTLALGPVSMLEQLREADRTRKH